MHKALAFLSRVQQRKTKQKSRMGGSHLHTVQNQVKLDFGVRLQEGHRRAASADPVLFLWGRSRVVQFAKVICVLFYTHVPIQFVFSLHNGRRLSDGSLRSVQA